jgi:hypothetical protein
MGVYFNDGTAAEDNVRWIGPIGEPRQQVWRRGETIEA